MLTMTYVFRPFVTAFRFCCGLPSRYLAWCRAQDAERAKTDLEDRW